MQLAWKKGDGDGPASPVFRSPLSPFPQSLSPLLSLGRFLGQLCSLPAGDHPDDPVLTTVEKTIGRNDHLAKGKAWKLRNEPAGPRESSEASEGALRLPTEPEGGPQILLQNIGYRLEKLESSGGCEPELHLAPPARRASASASTSSKSNPFPARISCSPRASRWRS